MRIVKEHDERKNEILDAAEKLFMTKGYEKSTVNDILNELSIAKGTFYYYFKSKQEVLEEIVSRYADNVLNRVYEIINQNNVDPLEKLMRAFMSMQIRSHVSEEMMEELHKSENALLHQKTLNKMIAAMAPALVKIIEEGIGKQVWRCRYPLEYMQIILASSLTLTDEDFELDGDSKMKVMTALISLLEMMLEVHEGSFLKLFMENMAL